MFLYKFGPSNGVRSILFSQASEVVPSLSSPMPRGRVSATFITLLLLPISERRGKFSSHCLIGFILTRQGGGYCQEQ